MPLKAISGRIIDEAREEARRIKENAREEAAAIVARAGAEGAGRIDNEVEQAVAAGERIRLQRTATARLEARDAVIEAKQELIDRAFAQASERLKTLAGADYANLLAGLIADAARGGDEVILDPADAALAKKVIDGANAALKEAGRPGVSAAAERREIGRGFILRRGAVEENHSFDRLLAGAREEDEARVAKTIFGDPK